MNTIIIKPIITEKSIKDVESGKYTFQTALLAHKPAIKKAIEREFNVHVTSLTSIIVKGKTQRQGKRREEITLAPTKKVIVGLKKGETIDLFNIAG